MHKKLYYWTQLRLLLNFNKYLQKHGVCMVAACSNQHCSTWHTCCALHHKILWGYRLWVREKGLSLLKPAVSFCLWYNIIFVSCNPNLRLYKYTMGHCFGRYYDGAKTSLLFRVTKVGTLHIQQERYEMHRQKLQYCFIYHRAGEMRRSFIWLMEKVTVVIKERRPTGVNG